MTAVGLGANTRQQHCRKRFCDKFDQNVTEWRSDWYLFIGVWTALYSISPTLQQGKTCYVTTAVNPGQRQPKQRGGQRNWGEKRGAGMQAIVQAMHCKATLDCGITRVTHGMTVVECKNVTHKEKYNSNPCCKFLYHVYLHSQSGPKKRKTNKKNKPHTIHTLHTLDIRFPSYS